MKNNVQRFALNGMFLNVSGILKNKTHFDAVGSSSRPRKSWILIAVIAALAIIIGILIWIANSGAK